MNHAHRRGQKMFLDLGMRTGIINLKEGQKAKFVFACLLSCLIETFSNKDATRLEVSQSCSDFFRPLKTFFVAFLFFLSAFLDAQGTSCGVLAFLIVPE